MLAIPEHLQCLLIQDMIGLQAEQAIDDTVAKVLGLPDFSVLRELLAQEPVVCLKPLA